MTGRYPCRVPGCRWEAVPHTVIDIETRLPGEPKAGWCVRHQRQVMLRTKSLLAANPTMDAREALAKVVAQFIAPKAKAKGQPAEPHLDWKGFLAATRRAQAALQDMWSIVDVGHNEFWNLLGRDEQAALSACRAMVNGADKYLADIVKRAGRFTASQEEK